MSREEDSRRFLRPEVVSRISRMDLVARLVVEGFITGLHRSPYHGFSVEFSEFRPYLPGEATRHIDWKLWGRTDRYFVKRFEEETNLKAFLLLDASASMGFTSGPVTKLRYSGYLAASLAFLMLRQRDAVGLVTFDEKIRAFLPPRSVPSYLHLLLAELEKTAPGGETGIAAIFHRLAERLKRRGLVIVFSDLLDEPDEVLAALKHFRHQKHEVIVFHVLDPLEQSLDFRTDTLFVDAETGERLHADPRRLGAAYRDSMRRFSERIARECRASDIDYVALDTAQPFDVALFRYLTRRKRMGG
jgi:uncharacterized protein (DUF58 family)